MRNAQEKFHFGCSKLNTRECSKLNTRKLRIRLFAQGKPSGGPGVPFSADLQARRFPVSWLSGRDHYRDLSGRDHYRDGRLDLANVAWDKVAGRQTLNCFEARPPLAKEEMPARRSSALAPASPQRRLLESWSSAPHPFHLCLDIH